VDEFAAEDQGVVSDVLNAERAFDRRWAMTLLERAQTRLRADYAAAGKGPIYNVLQSFLSGEEAVPAYAGVAARLGMPENTVKSAVHRLRRHYGRLVREEIASTVETPAQIDEEIRYLLSVIGEEAP
jgi:hypothetical protein